MHNHLVTPEEIKNWCHNIAYQLDEPGVVVLDEITAIKRDWNKEPYKSDLKFCLTSPVTYESVVSNLGCAILWDEINDHGAEPSTTGVLCERCYFPEKKLFTRLQKKGFPLFSKENFVPLKNFDVVGFSSYYPLQYFNIPRMLEMSDIPVFERDRTNSNSPIIMGGGISFFNPEPVTDFFDFFFLGEGEKKLLHVLQMAKECKDENGDIDREKYLYRLVKETDYIYVPKFYDVKYFTGFGVKERTSLIPEAKPVLSRAVCNIYENPPITRTFVPVVASSDMSIGSVEISRGKTALSTRCFFANGGVKSLKDINVGDSVSAFCSTIQGNLSVLDKVIYPSSEDMYELTTRKGRTICASLDHPFLINNEWKPLLRAKQGDLIATAEKLPSPIVDNPAFTDDELKIIGAFTADGYMVTTKHLDFQLNKKHKEASDYVVAALKSYGIDCSQSQNSAGVWVVRTRHNIPRTDIANHRDIVCSTATEFKLFAKWNLLDKKSAGKIWPDFVFDLSLRQKALLMASLGSYDLGVLFSKDQYQISFGSVSKEQSIIYQDLLLCFGVHTSLIFHKASGKRSDGYWSVKITTKEDILAAEPVLSQIKFRPDIEDILYWAHHGEAPCKHAVPGSIWNKVLSVKNELGDSWVAFNSYYNTGRNGDPTEGARRNTLSLLRALQAFNFPEWHKFFANDEEFIRAISKDIYWDEIVSIKKIDHPIDAADITTEHPYHNYLGNGFYVHNCSASCSFCEGSARTMPLRERPTEVAMKAFDEIKKNTGCMDITPYGFNLSDHSNIRTLIKYLAKDPDVKIQMSSQRIDMFTRDFAEVAKLSGTRSVTLAIEGGSQRMRNAVNKNLMTDQILEAFEIAFAVGMNKVKIYMIANLPFETPEDISGIPTQLVSADTKITLLDGTETVASDERLICEELEISEQDTDVTEHPYDEQEIIKVEYEDGSIKYFNKEDSITLEDGRIVQAKDLLIEY